MEEIVKLTKPMYEPLTRRCGESIVTAWRELSPEGTPVVTALIDFNGLSTFGLRNEMTGETTAAQFNFPINNVKTFAEAFAAFEEAKSLHVRGANMQIQMQRDQAAQQQLAAQQRAEIARAVQGLSPLR